MGAETEVPEEDSLNRDVNEICHRLHEAIKPVLSRILDERRAASKPASTALLGIVAFAACEASLPIQVMARYGANQGRLVELCTENFRQWMLDCIEQNTAELPN